jgi:hypothetical protein
VLGDVTVDKCPDRHKEGGLQEQVNNGHVVDMCSAAMV